MKQEGPLSPGALDIIVWQSVDWEDDHTPPRGTRLPILENMLCACQLE